MLKKILLTSAVALAITAGATAINSSNANAGVRMNLSFGGGQYDGFYGGFSDKQYINRYAGRYDWN